jgi:hypothetical protein
MLTPMYVFSKVTKEEFLMYYSGVGTAFESDEEFAAMLNNSWKQLRKRSIDEHIWTQDHA